MPIGICPQCNERYSYASHSGDYVHQCPTIAPEVLRKEDLVVIESRSEEFGETVNTDRSPGEVMYQGLANKLQGTRAGVEGAYYGGVNKWGTNKQTHRQRQYYQYIENPNQKSE